MASSMHIKITCLAVICLILGIPLANATLSCDQMTTSLIPCIGYVRNPVASVPAPCCDAVRAINDADCKDLCNCFNFIMLKMPEFNDPAFSTIPNNCGLQVHYSTCFAMDCD
ncbi:non-specific lipid-transfer protein [Trifolium pratense]|uniref:Non-specific lipid-transfer protein n=1 Tax=Trifolium pratense TaxID=57577 RepID=A0A2K3K096_TRIPR|nr:non-specific lipid-transfer protein [Trifolium pratense]PNX86116.1 non-specific lipid-transfer protein [Trifolium pratense]